MMDNKHRTKLNEATYSFTKEIINAKHIIVRALPCENCGGQPNVSIDGDKNIVIHCCSYKVKNKHIKTSVAKWNKTLTKQWLDKREVSQYDLRENIKLIQQCIQ